MYQKEYYWADGLEDYQVYDSETKSNFIEIRRLNFFIGKNNSGKSRFLRKLVLNEKEFFNYQAYDIENEVNSLVKHTIKYVVKREKKNGEANYITNSRGDMLVELYDSDKVKLRQQLKALNEFSYDYSKLTTAIEEFEKSKYSFINTDAFNALKNKIERVKGRKGIETEHKVYIPVLRGMRPISIDEEAPYCSRTKKDYFEEIGSNVLLSTGESLYQELVKHLLGDPEDRILIRSYEKKLSQYFFDNENVTLIPKHDHDVVHIKIGDDKQFPISQLGDGLQQILVLTYEAYIKSKSKTIWAFFVEEPELHMHAGMVRQLMNFYLKETNHYYFFTTHSNHLLDMADESNQVVIHKLIKEKRTIDINNFNFNIYRCNRDRTLLSTLGVKPSSVYLSNCTIWVEGITDRLYIVKYMEKYLDGLKISNENLYIKYRKLMPNYHYSFVEYAGSNLVHWNFSEEFVEYLENDGLGARSLTNNIMLIADGDIRAKGIDDQNRVEKLRKSLGENFYLLECKEIENTLPTNLIVAACNILFSGTKTAFDGKEDLLELIQGEISKNGFQEKRKNGFDISLLNESTNFFSKTKGIGLIIDSIMSINTSVGCFSDKSGTIKNKLEFCQLILILMDSFSWELTQSASDLTQRIFEYISNENS